MYVICIVDQLLFIATEGLMYIDAAGEVTCRLMHGCCLLFFWSTVLRYYYIPVRSGSTCALLLSRRAGRPPGRSGDGRGGAVCIYVHCSDRTN